MKTEAKPEAPAGNSPGHTPGPWFVGGHPNDGSGTNWRAVLTNALEFGPSFVCAAPKDDARLIAAAPTMRAVLLGLKEYIDNGTPIYPGALVWKAAETAIELTTKSPEEILADRNTDVLPDPAGTGRGWTAVRVGRDDKGPFEEWIGEFFPDRDAAVAAALNWEGGAK